MEKVTHVSNITISENTVVISLKRYNELLDTEKHLKENVVYTKGNAWSWNPAYVNTVFTNDEAIKTMAEDMSKLQQEVVVVTVERDKLKDDFVAPKLKYSWREIFAIIKNKYL
jgi:hypothetical protein